MTTYRAECWASVGQTWVEMERLGGRARAVPRWRPRADREAVIRLAWRWTGGLDIPRMRVVEVETGVVVWTGEEEAARPAGERRAHYGQDPAAQGSLF